MCYFHQFFVCWGLLLLVTWNGGRLYVFWCDVELVDWWFELELYCLFCFRILILFLSFSVLLVLFSSLWLVLELFLVCGFLHCFFDVVGFRSWILFSSYILWLDTLSVLGFFLVSLFFHVVVENWLVMSVKLDFCIIPALTAFGYGCCGKYWSAFNIVIGFCGFCGLYFKVLHFLNLRCFRYRLVASSLVFPIVLPQHDTASPNKIKENSFSFQNQLSRNFLSWFPSVG